MTDTNDEVHVSVGAKTVCVPGNCGCVEPPSDERPLPRCTLSPTCWFGPHDAAAHPCGKPWPPAQEALTANLAEGERAAADPGLVSIDAIRDPVEP